MFKIFMIICMTGCGPAPVKVEYFQDMESCKIRAAVLVDDVIEYFVRYGVAFSIGYECRTMETA